jgi:hypothetical protein
MPICVALVCLNECPFFVVEKREERKIQSRSRQKSRNLVILDSGDRLGDYRFVVVGERANQKNNKQSQEHRDENGSEQA